MSYEVGTHIDLKLLDNKIEAVVADKKSLQQTISNAYDVGTQIIFNFKAGKVKMARRIPVIYA